MRIIMLIALGMLVAAPLIGRWRANAWLRKKMQTEGVAQMSRP
jgi:hypothetical protein